MQNGDHDVTSSIAPCEGVCAGANPVGHPNFDGSQDWVIAQDDEVAGSSPASSLTCWSSSVVEHVIPSSFLIRRIGRALALLMGRSCGLSHVNGSTPFPESIQGSSMVEQHGVIPQHALPIPL